MIWQLRALGFVLPPPPLSKCWHFRWRSRSDQAACPFCHTVSQHSAKLYTEHTVQDFPLAGKAVYHTVTNTRYVCDQPDGLVYTFVESMEDFAVEVSHERTTVLQARTGLASAESTAVPAPETASVPAPGCIFIRGVVRPVPVGSILPKTK